MQNIRIRVASPKDADALLEIYKPYVLDTAVTFEYEVPSTSEFRRRINNVLEKYPYLVAEDNGEIVGYAYACAFHERPACGWAVETSVYVKQERRKQGIGKHLYKNRLVYPVAT